MNQPTDQLPTTRQAEQQDDMIRQSSTNGGANGFPQTASAVAGPTMCDVYETHFSMTTKEHGGG